MSRFNKTEFASKLASIIERKQRLVSSLAGATNPQQVAMRLRAEGEIDSFQTVLDVMRGNSLWFNIEARTSREENDAYNEKMHMETRTDA